MNKKLKKVLITLISVLVCLCLTAGGVLAAVMKKRAVPVNVYSIADVSTQDFGGSTETYGTVETGHTQMIYLDKDKVLKETKVSQGDPVKKGDVLMTYDGTVEQLTLERQSLSIQSKELNLQLLGKEIDELASKIPYATTKAAFQASGRVKADTSDPAEESSSGSDPGSENTGSESSGAESSSQESSAGEGSIPEDSKKDDSKPEESSEASEPVEKEPDGSKEHPFVIEKDTDHLLIGRDEWEQYRGYFVLFRISKAAGQDTDKDRDQAKTEPLYTLTYDLTCAQPLADGETVSLETVIRPVRRSVTIVTLLQKELPGPLTLQFPLPDGALEDGLEMSGVTDSDFLAKIEKRSDHSVNVELTGGGIYLLTADTDAVKPDDNSSQAPLPDDSGNTDNSQDNGGQIPDIFPDDNGEDSIPEPDITDPESQVDYDALRKELEQKRADYIDKSIQIKLDKIDYQKAQNKLDQLSVKADADGVVLTMTDPKAAEQQDLPYMVIAADTGYFVSGSMSELNLETVAVGDTVSVMDYMTGNYYPGQIISVGDQPVSSNYYGGGNPNVSYYPFTVKVMPGSDGQEPQLTEGSGVSISIDTAASDAIFLENMFICNDENQPYVYKQDQNGRLVKQVISTGRTLYGEYTEILDGLTQEDYVAFPYGKSVREGARCTISTIDQLYQ